MTVYEEAIRKTPMWMKDKQFFKQKAIIFMQSREIIKCLLTSLIKENLNSSLGTLVATQKVC